MKLLLDQGLPRSTVLHLQNHGVDAVHVGDKGLATATDSKILDVGRQEGMAVVTLDADFHALLALSGVTGPSVIRIRIEGLRGERACQAAGKRVADLRRRPAERGDGLCD
jgi:predicted nuclease of predicted toxin-antitoxin system